MLRFLTTFTDSNGGGTKYNNLYFSGVDAPDALAAKEQVVAWWTAMDTYMSTAISWALDPLVAVIEATTGDTLDIYNVGTAGDTGESTTDPLPLASQGLVRLATNSIVNNRLVRGRINVPGLTEAVTLNGRFTPAFADAMAIAANSSFSLAGEPQLQVWSRPFSGSASSDPRVGSANDVIAITAWQEVAILRSRRD